MRERPAKAKKQAIILCPGHGQDSQHDTSHHHNNIFVNHFSYFDIVIIYQATFSAVVTESHRNQRHVEAEIAKNLNLQRYHVLMGDEQLTT
jgi:anthranilate/para-aminobenzoate synthase component II